MARFSMGCVAVAVLALGLAACGKSSDNAIPDGSASAATTVTVTPRPDDIVRGKADAPVTFIEYASMTCPHCARWQKDVLPQLIKNYVDTGKVRYIFREFPLDGAARMASGLARCQKGDAFHSMIDLIFKNQEAWIKDANGDGNITQEDVATNLEQIARVAGMSKEQADACMNDPKNLAIVDANWQEAQTKYNIQSTPTFFANGEQHVGEWSWTELDATMKRLTAGH